MTDDDPDSDWQRWWDARVAAMQHVFGPTDGKVAHAPIPFDFGAKAGGASDVVYFREFLPESILAVTCELIGRDDQVTSALGNYELAICQRADDPWGPYLISRLAHYTREATLNAGETMDIGSAVPAGSSISALLFLELARFEVLGRRAGVLLCIGLTPAELSACRNGQAAEVESALRRNGVYPHTDHARASVVRGKKWGLF